MQKKDQHRSKLLYTNKFKYSKSLASPFQAGSVPGMTHTSISENSLPPDVSFIAVEISKEDQMFIDEFKNSAGQLPYRYSIDTCDDYHKEF